MRGGSRSTRSCPDAAPFEFVDRARGLGSWVVVEGRGEVEGAPYEALLTLGYDSSREAFVGTWVDSYQDWLWIYEGELDESGRVLTLHTQGPSLDGTGTETEYRETIELTDPDHKVHRGWVRIEDGSWSPLVVMKGERVQP